MAALLLSCSDGNGTKREICFNGKDDDGNGLTDCADPDCAGQPGCPGGNPDSGYYGTCVTCGSGCTAQSACIDQRWDFDNPLPFCVDGKCESYNQGIQVALQVDTSANWNGFMYPIGSMNTRFVSKTALDGGAVDCAVMQVAAAGKTQADAAQIEASGRFNLLGYDVAKVSASGGSIIRQPFVNVGTGGDFVLWVELWAGPPDSVTKLPTGNRFGWGCYESGATLAPIAAADNCDPNLDAGTCRDIKVVMPGPQ